SYLIIWADEDQEQSSSGELHTNFKLSTGGEVLILSSPIGELIEDITFGEQQVDVSFARIPNGTGDFQFRTETFNANNDGSSSSVLETWNQDALRIYPNPTSGSVQIKLESELKDGAELLLLNAPGQVVYSTTREDLSTPIDLSNIPNGVYLLLVRNPDTNEQFRQKIMILK
ncbi:MAG: T9SS type A sorting domain-containing protein, partial [Phaeodactylibacter sp.]|nr:T9SS type A sorting domain-containing protein [Phaeodactylibacter sp.]